jgi:hypothetical protein
LWNLFGFNFNLDFNLDFFVLIITNFS